MLDVHTGLTNLNTIFHLNNLALPQGRPTPDTGQWREAPPYFFISFILFHKDSVQPVRADKRRPLCFLAAVCPRSIHGQ